MKVHPGNTLELNNDIRHRLFRSYALICVILGLLFTVINAINKRPMINILTGIFIALVCGLIYFLTNKDKFRGLARLIFLFFFTFIYIPFSYPTTPGTQSAMPYLMILVVFILTVVCVRPWEYFFPFFVIMESLILFRLEISQPELFYVYTDPVYRINYVVVTLAIMLTMVFIMHQYNRYNKELYDKSTRDVLTGLYNKRYFDDFAKLEYERALKGHTIFSLVLIDINHFKKVNDVYGHLRGDQVLAEIAAIIKENFPNDICVRYGGDEFLVLVQDTQKQALKDRLIDLEEAFKVYFEAYEDLRLAAGIGVADSKDKTLNEIIALADGLLYKDKVDKKA
ncbi:GGDEF domain-containing protein [Acidaminobacter sp. JC074]|uniref:GGDEF domain-containing protein n=1 Tax=Acidaminobacter sp. JC074 TaxID=2530199 RepID=UPI001F10D3F4|nr:GGDEF domain-containing protein [Acidaminobacter sp. JC074]MCH4888426.1 GGDEF domain-containing protein [Acidaminobacter sp. JC074]